MFPWENSQNKFYTGIGSRETPLEIMNEMTRIAKILDSKRFILRSGGAPGADTAFENGIKNMELYLPWPGFNKRTKSTLDSATKEAREIAAKHHPAWTHLKPAVQALIARNTHQVLGQDCNTPSNFILCWTPDGTIKETSIQTGGTGQAIRIAAAYNIPIYNLKREDHLDLWKQLI